MSFSATKVYNKSLALCCHNTLLLWKERCLFKKEKKEKEKSYTQTTYKQSKLNIESMLFDLPFNNGKKKWGKWWAYDTPPHPYYRKSMYLENVFWVITDPAWFWWESFEVIMKWSVASTVSGDIITRKPMKGSNH